MSRENFYVQCRGENEEKIQVFLASIQYMYTEVKEGKEKKTLTKLVMANNVTLTVLDAPEHIIKMGEKFGVVRELK